MKRQVERQVEYAIQIRSKYGYEDCSLYNRRTCRWEKPIEDWARAAHPRGWNLPFPASRCATGGLQ